MNSLQRMIIVVAVSAAATIPGCTTTKRDYTEDAAVHQLTGYAPGHVYYLKKDARLLSGEGLTRYWPGTPIRRDELVPAGSRFEITRVVWEDDFSRGRSLLMSGRLLDGPLKDRKVHIGALSFSHSRGEEQAPNILPYGTTYWIRDPSYVGLVEEP